MADGYIQDDKDNVTLLSSSNKANTLSSEDIYNQLGCSELEGEDES